MGKDSKHSKDKKRKREKDEKEERRDRRHNEKLVRQVYGMNCELGFRLARHRHTNLASYSQAEKISRHLKKHNNSGHGYNNEENPFGDSNLGSSFVWGKKIEKQLHEGADVRDLTAKAERQRQVDRTVCLQQSSACCNHCALGSCGPCMVVLHSTCGLAYLACMHLKKTCRGTLCCLKSDLPGKSLPMLLALSVAARDDAGTNRWVAARVWC